MATFKEMKNTLKGEVNEMKNEKDFLDFDDLEEFDVDSDEDELTDEDLDLCNNLLDDYDEEYLEELDVDDSEDKLTEGILGLGDELFDNDEDCSLDEVDFEFDDMTDLDSELDFGGPPNKDDEDELDIEFDEIDDFF